MQCAGESLKVTRRRGHTGTRAGFPAFQADPVVQVAGRATLKRERSLRIKKMGFEMLPQNVNEQSKSTSVVNVWYKKGTGPAITDVMLVDQAIDSEQWCNSTKMAVPGIPICNKETIPATRPYET